MQLGGSINSVFSVVMDLGRCWFKKMVFSGTTSLRKVELNIYKGEYKSVLPAEFALTATAKAFDILPLASSETENVCAEKFYHLQCSCF